VDNIKKALEKTKITPYRIQKDLGIAEGTIRGWMRGNMPKADLLFKVADYLGIDPRYLLGLRGEIGDEMTAVTDRIILKLLRYEDKKPGSLKNIEKIIDVMIQGVDSGSSTVRKTKKIKRIWQPQEKKRANE
jgi:transcriptional regulator with XRE-family HTH domain